MGTAVFQLPTWTLGVIPEHHTQPLVLILKVTGVSLRPALRSSGHPSTLMAAPQRLLSLLLSLQFLLRSSLGRTP